MPVHLLLPSRVTWLLLISRLLHIFPWSTVNPNQPKKTPQENTHRKGATLMKGTLFQLHLPSPCCSGFSRTGSDKGRRWQRRKFLLFSYSWIYLLLAWQALHLAFLQLKQHTPQLYSFLPLAVIRQNSVRKHFPVLKWEGKLEYRLICCFFNGGKLEYSLGFLFCFVFLLEYS